MPARTWKLQGITLLILLGAIAALSLDGGRTRPVGSVSLAGIPRRIEGLEAGADRKLPQGTEERLAATKYLDRSYSMPGLTLDVFIAYYAEQRAGESMHSPRNCLPGSGWEISQADLVGLPGRRRQAVVNRYAIRNGADRRVVLYWYQTRRRVMANELFVKGYLIWDVMRDGDHSGSLVRVVMPDRPAAEAVGRRFASRLIDALDDCLAGAAAPVAAVRASGASTP